MPDFERLYRKLELHMANDEEQRIILAYHAGLDRARKEVAVIFSAAALIFTALRLWA